MNLSRTSTRWPLRALPCLLLCLLASTLVGEERVRYGQAIRPILAKKCFPCHGPDENKREGRLRLDQADGDEGAYRVRRKTRAVHAGQPESSALWKRVTTKDEDDIMPPVDAGLDSVTSEEKELIHRWILQGAEYEDFWSFVPLGPQDLPQPENAEWSSQAIDRFVLSRLEKDGLEPQPRASKRTLIRRLTLDLTGLPPSVEEIRAFLADDSEAAYENLVERLLARPQYGEHMAKYWLDLVRFADTNGLHHDHYREMTPYRDWVIRAFNENLPFDQFITYQVAGDLFSSPSIDQQIASGFNRLHLIIDRGTALPEESFTRNVIDRVTAVGSAFLGLTVQCAVCHDHKYDPITQKDFYQLYAFFNNFDGGPETGGRNGADFKRGLQAPYITLPSPQQRAELGEVDEEIARLEALVQAIESGQGVSDASRAEAELSALSEKLKERRKSRTRLLETFPATLVMKERAEPRPAHVLIRGAYDQPGEAVERNTPAFLPPMEKKDGLKTRLDLAKWLVSPSQPLTPRVAVNRFWQQFFGIGLVRTSEDFGMQGEWPSHPELLDHLAHRFLQSGWDVKKLVRSIVLSEAYRQSSKASPRDYLADPDNRLLARGARFRLDSEVVRDQILAVSGLLNPQMYGKSVKPPQPANLWTAVAMPFSYPRVFKADTGDQIYRRSIYTFWKRALPPPQMTIFDAPSRESCIARRERTNTPLQALVLMNEEQYFYAAIHFARRLLQKAGPDEERLSRTYEMVTSQLPEASEQRALGRALRDFKVLFAEDQASARALVKTLGDESLTDEERTDLAAWTLVVHSLLNLDITKTRQ